MLTYALLVCAFALLCGYGGAHWVLRRARRMGLVSHPADPVTHHHRSKATGGGFGIVLGGSLACLFVATNAIWPAILVLAVSLAMAAIGLREDIRELHWFWRLAAQVLLMLVLTVLGIPLDALAGAIGLGGQVPLTLLLVLVAGIAWINFFNFMEGVDGLAAAEAIFLLLAAAALTYFAVPGVAELPVFWWLVALAAATAGFLALNWPPARILMGDTGSTYLALIIAFLAMVTLSLRWLTLAQWLILAGVFIADAAVTLVRRLLRRAPVFEVHRSHAYQHLLRRWGSHRTITLGVIAIDVLVLLPLAIWAGREPGIAWAIVGATYLCLVGLALYAGAGGPEKDEAAA